MAIIRTKDYRSDIVLTLHMTLGGETVNVPQHDFVLRFFTEHEARHYDCGRIKGEWLHCAPDESDTTLLTCYIKNHGLGCGMLQCLYVDLSPNDGMEDGVQRTFSVSGIDLELVDDASDDTQAVDGSVIVDINAVLTELHDAADAAIASQQKNIASIVYLASDQPGGQNIITITLNDGTVIIGTVLNGKDGNGSDEQDYVKDVKLNGRSVVTNKGVAMIDTEASQLPALVTIDGIRKENVLDALVALNQYISSVEESIDEHGGETELVFGSLNNGIFYDINGNEAVRSASLLYVDRNTGIIYRWGTNSFEQVGGKDLGEYSLKNVPFLENPDTSNPDVYNIYKTYADYVAWLRDHSASRLMSVAELLAYLDANIGQYVYVLDAASSPEYVQRLSVAGGIAGQSSATTYIELRSHDNAPGLKISFSIDRTATNTGTTLTAERSTGLTTASYNGNTKVNEVSIAPAGVLTKLANGTTTTYNLPSSSGTLALASEVANARPMRVTATWDASASAYTYESAVDVDTMYQSFYSQGKVLELHLVNGNYNGLVLTCHGGYTSNNERHLKFSGSGDGKLIEADVVGTAVTVNYEDINEISGALYGKQDKTLLTSTIPATGLLPNVCYDYGTTDSVSITLATNTDTVADFYLFRFTCLSASCVVTLPSACKLPVDATMEMAAGRRFEVVIDEDMCVTFNSWD